MELTCRLCLLNEKLSFPIFPCDQAESETLTLAMQIQLCTSVVIAPLDNLPQQICKKCFNFLRDWLEFRQRCVDSDKKLKLNSAIKNTTIVNEIPSADIPLSAISKAAVNDTEMHINVNIDKPAAVERKEKKPIRKAASDHAYLQCCGHTFLTKISYRGHMKKCHAMVVYCDDCGKKGFSSKVTLRRHKLLHSKRYQCGVCPKAFTCKAIMRVHERSAHENDRPYVCDVCGKAFVTALILTYHQRFHYDERNYICEVCGRAFVTSSNLAKHKVTHSNIRPHMCEMCGKGFIVRSRMVQHMRMHTGERPFACDLCEKKYTSHCKLKRHKKTHNALVVK